jgi:hypothetical protein
MKRRLNKLNITQGGELKLDAADQIFFLRELQQKLAGSFDVKYAELIGRKLVGTGEMIDSGAESVRYEQYDSQGKAKRIANAADDLPGVAVKGKEFFASLDNYGLSYQYTLQEIQSARMANKPLESMRANACRKGCAQMLDDIIASGDSDTGTLGLLNQTSALDNTANMHGGYLTASADNLLDDMFNVVDYIPSQTKEVEHPRRLILPAPMYRIVSRKPRSTTSDTTVLQFFKDNRPEIEVLPWERTAGQGAGGKDRMVAYDPDPINVRLLLAVEYDQLPPQQKNFAFVINGFFRSGGVIMPYPKTMCYGDVAG